MGPDPNDPFEILGIGRGSRKMAPEDLRAAFRQRAKEAHPDKGGDANSFHRLKKALDDALAELSATVSAKGSAPQYDWRRGKTQNARPPPLERDHRYSVNNPPHPSRRETKLRWMRGNLGIAPKFQIRAWCSPEARRTARRVPSSRLRHRRVARWSPPRLSVAACGCSTRVRG